MVLCALDTWNSNHSGWDHQHLHRLRSLPQENVSRYKDLDNTFHSPGLCHGFLLPFSGQMGLYAKAGSDFREYSANHIHQYNYCSKWWYPKGVGAWTMCQEQCTWELVWLVIIIIFLLLIKRKFLYYFNCGNYVPISKNMQEEIYAHTARKKLKNFILYFCVFFLFFFSIRIW